MTGIHVLLCFAIILNMGFVYIVYKIWVTLEIFAGRMNINLSGIEGHAQGIVIVAKEIHKNTENIGK